MNTARLHPVLVITALVATALGLALVSFAANSPDLPTAPAAAASGPKDHSLFVGMDYSIKVDGKYRRVIGAGKRSFIVEDNGKRKEISAGKALDIRMTRGVKLSNLTAEVAKFSGIMTSEADVAEQFRQTGAYIAMTSNAEIQQANFDRAIHEAFDESMFATAGSVNHGLAVAGTTLKWLNQIQTDAVNAMVMGAPMLQSEQSVASDMNLRATGEPPNTSDSIQIVPDVSATGANLAVETSASKPESAPGSASPSAAGASGMTAGTKASAGKTVPVGGRARAVISRAVRDASGGHPDRLDFELEISSPEPLDNAYFILVTEFSVPSSPTELHNRVYVDRLPSLDGKPHKVKIYERDYPVGFQLRGYTLSVYSNGQEVATNMSRNRVDLTADEAYQYVALDYLASHKGETHPPAAILMTSRSRLRAVADPAAFRQPVFVSVDQNGNVVSVSASDTGAQPVPTSIANALQDFRFVPALNKGAPVAGRAKIVLAEFID